MKERIFFGTLILTVTILVTVIVAQGPAFQAGYQAGLTNARVDSWNRELAWRKAVSQLEADLASGPARIRVVFLNPQATFGDAPSDAAIGVFRDSGENRFTRYTIQGAVVKTERYADEWGKKPLEPLVTSY